MVLRVGPMSLVKLAYMKLLDFADFAVHSAKSGIGPFARGFWNLNQSIEQKIKNLQWEKCRYITDIEITFWDTAQYFHSKHLKS